MTTRTWDRLTAAVALGGVVFLIGRSLAHERTRRHERVTLESVAESIAEVHPATQALWDKTEPARDWVATHAPGLGETGVAVGLAVIVATTGLVLGFLDDVADDEVAYDIALGNAVERWQHPRLVRAAEWISEAAAPGGTSLVTVGVVGLLFRRGRRVEALGLSTAVVGTAVITTIMKEMSGRPRPKGVDIYNPMGHSFPSGHTSGTAALYAYLAWMLTRHRSTDARVVALGVAGAVTGIVASCRVYLAVHWLSDVLAGGALGVAVATGTALGTRRLLARQADRVAEGKAETTPETAVAP